MRFRAFPLAASFLLLAAQARAADAGVDADGGIDAGADASSDASDDAGAPIVATACADPIDHCERALFQVERGETIGADFDFDTGWVPSGSAVQVRLIAFLHGRTTVTLGGFDDTTWPEALTMKLTPEKGSGAIGIDDGFEIRAQARFHVTVAGTDYDWSGDIPGVPKLVLTTKQTVFFDPFAWKELGKPAAVSGTTGKVTIVKVPLTSAIVPIPGISGGFDLDGDAEFDASYVTTRIGFDETFDKGAIEDVTFAFPTTHALLAESIPFFETAMTVHGELTHQIKLHFVPGFYFEILGSKFELPIADLPVSLPSSTEDWRFPDVRLHFPLPKVEVSPQDVDLGDVQIGRARELGVSVFDTGEAKLVVDAADPKGTFAVSTAHLAIEPGYSDTVKASFTPTGEGPFEGTIVLTTNDPHTPTTIHVKGNAVTNAPPPSDETPANQAGSCGCHFPGSDDASPVLPLLPASLLLFFLRRKRA